MIIVSNTSPIINLACIESLNVLKNLYKKIYIPEGVYEEITRYKQPGYKEVKNDKFFIKNAIKNQALAILLEQDLDKGEAETIVLGLELKSDLILMDEKLGRLKAQTLSLKYTGLIGILLHAKSLKIITAIKPYLDALVYKAGFYLSKDVYSTALNLANEK